MPFFDFLHIFTDLFNAAERAWNKLKPDVQNALVHGSGIIKLISDNIDKAPDELFTIIQTKYPDITKEKLESGLGDVAKYLEIDLSGDLTSVLKNLQTYFSMQQGKFWDISRSVLSQILAFALAPEQTAMGLITNLMEWVFRKKVK